MDTNLTLSAQILTLAPNLQHSEAINGLLVVKNVSAKTYLKITTAQWRILRLFGEPRTVPTVLAQQIDNVVKLLIFCPAQRGLAVIILGVDVCFVC